MIKLIKKVTRKIPQNRIMTTSMLGRNFLPNKAKGRRKQRTTKLTTGVSGIRHGYNMTQKEREIMDV